MAYVKIGFHAGVGGNRTGIGEYFRQLDAAGVPFAIKSVDDGGLAAEAAGYTNADHVIVYRPTRPAGRGNDLPDYSRPPEEEGPAHWARVHGDMPPEVAAVRDRVWIETGNEFDKTLSDWMGAFAYHYCLAANADGYRVIPFACNNGEPERSHWQTQGMRQFLGLAAQRPEQIAVGLHEGKIGDMTAPAKDYWPHLYGRFTWLLAECDAMGLGHPSILVSESQFAYDDMPAPDVAMADIKWLAEQYARHPEVLGVCLWTLHGGSEWGGLPDKLQRLIVPVTDYALATRFPDPVPLPEETFEQYLWRLSVEKQSVSLNPKAALQRAIFADQFTPVESEFRFYYGGAAYAVQAGEHVGLGERQAYYCLVPHWDSVDFVDWPVSEFEKQMWQASVAKQAISLNPKAALQQAIFGAGFTPVETEFRATYGDRYVAAQAGEHVGTGARRVYWCEVPEWNNVHWFADPEEPLAIIDVVDELPKHETLTYDTRDASDIEALTIHHTVSVTTPEAFALYHVTPGRHSEDGWPGIGYHYLVYSDGRVYQTNYLTTISYHDAINYNSVGIALVGNFCYQWPTDAQLDATRRLIGLLRGALPGVTVRGHGDVRNTRCPGDTWPEWRPAIMGEAQGVSLDVPYLSQWGADAGASTGDCGPATVAMLVRYWRNTQTTVDEAAQACGQKPGSKSATTSQLRLGLDKLGVAYATRQGLTLDDLRAELDQGHPIILLIHYGSLPGRQDTYTAGHFVVAVGYGLGTFAINDPDWWGDRMAEGDHWEVAASDLERAMADCGIDDNPVNYGIVTLGADNDDPPPPPPPSGVDLLPYLRGKPAPVRHMLHYNWAGGGQHPVQTVNLSDPQGLIAWRIAKGGQFEELWADDRYIYRGLDTSEGGGRSYAQWMRTSGGLVYGAPWIPRRMEVGQEFTFQPHIIHYWSDGSVRLEGDPINRLKLYAIHDSHTFPNGKTLPDVAELGWSSGERYFYARDRSLVAWRSGTNYSYFDEDAPGSDNPQPPSWWPSPARGTMES